MTSLGDAYEWLDEQTADRMEDEIFRPAQAAYGRAQRTHAAFSERHELTRSHFDEAGHTGHPGDARGAIERAAASLTEADAILATFRIRCCRSTSAIRSCAPGSRAVRELIAPLPHQARQLLRMLGR